MRNKKVKWYIVFLITASTILVILVALVYFNNSAEIESDTFERLKTIATEFNETYEETAVDESTLQVKEETYYDLQKLQNLNDDVNRMD